MTPRSASSGSSISGKESVTSRRHRKHSRRHRTPDSEEASYRSKSRSASYPSRNDRRTRSPSSSTSSSRSMALQPVRDKIDSSGKRASSSHRRESARHYRESRSRSRSVRSRSRIRSRSRSSSEHRSTRERPKACRCIGVFGLNVTTTQSKIREIFDKFGPIERIQVVIDAQTGRSRGFCFIYFDNLADARAAKEACSGMEVDGRRIRVDYSITQRPHTPTPGIYLGRPTRSHHHRDHYDHRYDRYERAPRYYAPLPPRDYYPPLPHCCYSKDYYRRYDERSRSRSLRRTRY